MAPKAKNEPAADVDETHEDQLLNLDSPGDLPAIEPTGEPVELELGEELEPPKVAFELAGEVTGFRHCVGGIEISLDEGDRYLTNDAPAIAQLDGHDAVRRCEEQPA